MSSSERNPDPMQNYENAGQAANDSAHEAHNQQGEQSSNPGNHRGQPEYGAMASQYPGWNPYVYGAPETPTNTDQHQAQTPQGAQVQGVWPGNPPTGRDEGNNNAGNPNAVNNGEFQPPFSSTPQFGQPGGVQNQNRRGMYPTIDPNDPHQNPLYGRWDPYSIVSFVLAIFFPFPFMPAVMGAISVYRTRLFHMKGKGLAIAAIVINILYSALIIWMWANHIDANQLYQDIYNWAETASGTSGSSLTA